MSRCFLFFLGLLSALTLDASVIFDNGSPNQAGGSNMSAFISADDFSIDDAAVLTGAVFYSSADFDPYQAQFSGAIGWGVFSNGSSLPAGLLLSGTDNASVLADTGNQIDGTEEWQLQITFPNVSLPAGTYWFGLHESAFGTLDDGTEIYWDTTGNQLGSIGAVTSDLTGTNDGWFPNSLADGPDSALAFRLLGTSSAVPEPSSAKLLILSCCFIGLVSGRAVIMKLSPGH